MKIIGVIPARMASTRFPGKPLAKILGIPMVGHVYFRTRMSSLIDELYVATCDEEIKEYVNSIGGKAIMTSATHERASERTSEAMRKIEDQTGEKVGIVVMVQGDEPMVLPDMIDEAVQPIINDSDIQVTNLMSPLKSRSEHEDPNEIKVVVDRNDFALYFSREAIPTPKKHPQNIPMMKQVCIIPFRRRFLDKFNALEPTPLEIAESIDMLRILEHGYRVKMVRIDKGTYSVDTKEDLIRVEKLMENDDLMTKYAL